MGTGTSDLKKQLYTADISRKWLASELGISYNQLTSYLNGFSRMPDRIYRQIIKVLEKREQAGTL